MRGLAEATTEPAAAADSLAVYNPPTDVDIAAAELELMAPYVGPAPIGGLERQRVAQMIATLEGAGAVPPGVTPGDVVAFDLLPGA
ncbi:hypothetical protein JQS43_14275 [Natronosporangium hydrolyticum]|uniref:Uncharacterized protein n=1 Tax=Natronosporangium hydrolyticum TaxID=2811111 RepID=A0A895YE79_9ACTN|nr:hypothetical protein [Natronosporangium hydrolyticum]QSB12846.1 hypothetical protein JQS43_14275 [Natronosporangium hydrolyticum]